MSRYLLIVTILLALGPPTGGAQPIHRKLQKTVENYTLSEPTFASALAAVASQFKIPLGVELVATPSVLQRINRSWRKTTPMEIFNTLVRSEKGYQLRVDDGIVHVFQRGLVNQRSNFLNIRIPKFDVGKTTAPWAGQRLWELVNARLQPPKPLPSGGLHGGTAGSMFSRTNDRTFNLDLRNTTVRGVLDFAALASQYKVWIVAFAPGKALMPTGFRRTVSPTSDRIFPDADQPGLEQLRWGEKPY